MKLFVLLLLFPFLHLHASELDQLIDVVQKAKPDIKRVREAFKKEQKEKEKDPFNKIKINKSTNGMLSAHILLGQINTKDEDYLLKMYRGDDPEMGTYNYPAPNAPAISSLTAQVNGILQHISHAPQVYELEAMYVLYKKQQEYNRTDCIRESLGVSDYTKNYNYDPRAMYLLANYNTSLKSVQIHETENKERVYYYRGVLNHKDIIVQIYVPGNTDEAQIKIFSIKSLSVAEEKNKDTSAIPDLGVSKQKAPEKKDKNRWGKLYGGEYKGENGQIKGEIGFEYEHDNHYLPKNIKIWELEGSYNTEDLVLSVSSKLDTKDQVISTKVANKDNENNSLEFFLKDQNPGAKINNEFFAGEYKFKGGVQLYKKELSGAYSFSGPNPIFSLSTSFSIDQKKKTERYEVSKDLYRHSNDYESTVINLKFRQDRGEGHNSANDTVWLTLSKRF